MENSDAGETGIYWSDGGPDNGDADTARPASRRQTSPGETSRDEEEGDYHATPESARPQACVVYHTETHPEQNVDKEASETG